MDAKTERRNRSKVNDALAELGKTYHDGLPITQIDNILTVNGFKATESAIYCGREGRSSDRVGEFTYLSLSWYKMENSGRYEVVAYVS